MRFFTLVLLIGAGIGSLAAGLTAAEPSADRILTLIKSSKARSSLSDEALADLNHTYNTSPDGRAKALASIGLGINVIEDEPKKALEFFKEAVGQVHRNSEINVIARYYGLLARMGLDQNLEAGNEARALLSYPKVRPWRQRTFSIMMESYYQAQAFDMLHLAIRSRPEMMRNLTNRQEDLLRIAATTLMRKKQNAKAEALLEDLAEQYPLTKNARWALGLLQKKALGEKTDRPPYYFSREFLVRLSRATYGLNVGVREWVIAMADQTMRTRQGRLMEPDEKEQIEFLFDARIYDVALDRIKALEGLSSTESDAELREWLTLYRGRTHMRLFEPGQAARYFAKFLGEYPESKKARQVSGFLADAYKWMGEFSAASAQYGRVYNLRKTRSNRWQQFWMVYRSGKYNEALEMIDSGKGLRSRIRKEPEAVPYWRARVLDKLGRSQEASAQYQKILAEHAGSYYAQLVAARRPELVRNMSPNKALLSAKDGYTLAARILDRESSIELGSALPELELIVELIKNGLVEAAELYLQDLRDSDYLTETKFAELSRVARALDDYRSSKRIRYRSFSALRNLPRNWPEFVSHQRQFRDEWKVYYPMAFPDLVQAATSRTNVSPYLLLSIMRTESFYERHARSIVGARGLMQIMPYTGAKIARLLGDKEFNVSNLEEPTTSISYGAFYFDYLLKYYKGNQYLAVASYNAGPVAVNSWLEWCQGCDMDEFVASIPYNETRGYVKKVMATYANYLRIYDGQQGLGPLPLMPKGLSSVEEIF